MGGLSEQEKDRLILAFFDPGDDCAHNMTPAFAEIETIVARNVTAALTEAADAIEGRMARNIGGHPFAERDRGLREAARVIRGMADPP